MSSTRSRFLALASDSIEHEVTEEGTTVIRHGNGTRYRANGLASNIWRAVLAGHDEGAILEDLAVAYPAEPELDTHLSGFLDELLQHGLVKEQPDVGRRERSPISWPERFAAPRLDPEDDQA